LAKASGVEWRGLFNNGVFVQGKYFEDGVEKEVNMPKGLKA
jgi:hypothetical protein